MHTLSRRVVVKNPLNTTYHLVMSQSAEVKGLPASSAELIPSASDYGCAELHRNERLPTFLPPARTLNKAKNKSHSAETVAPLFNLSKLQLLYSPFAGQRLPRFPERKGPGTLPAHTNNVRHR